MNRDAGKMIWKRVYGFAKKSIQNRMMLERVFFSLIRLPLIGSIYDHIYFSYAIKPKSLGRSGWIAVEGYNLCNLRCVDCPYPVMTRPKIQMPLSLFQKIIEDSLEFGIRKVRLHNYGGPFLDSLLFDRIDFVKSKGMFVSINTNGTLLTTERIERIVDCGLDEIMFSIDGVSKETFERIRVGAQFEKVITSIKELIACKKRRRSKTPLVRVSCVVQRGNYEEMKEEPQKFHRLFKDTDIAGVTVADNRNTERLFAIE